MNINNLRGFNLNLPLNQISKKTDLANSDDSPENIYNNFVAQKAGFLDDFTKNYNDIVNEESSDVYSRYNAGSGKNGGALAFADLVRALWRTVTK